MTIRTRISVEDGDPGKAPFEETNHYSVLLDGVEQKYCLTADSVEGFVKRCVVSDSGEFATEGENIVTEVVKGKVELVYE